MAADAICPITWCNLCLAGDMRVSSCCFTRFFIVEIFARMHLPRMCQPDLASTRPGVSAIQSLHSVLVSWQGPPLVIV